MACPTCDHTLEGIGYRMFHCPRCGTLVGSPVAGAVHVPALVRRCREFKVYAGATAEPNWNRLGIAESINLPGNRS